jgi:regulator of protease activity HflC (stomatin/prohibitin superfamily)
MREPQSYEYDNRREYNAAMEKYDQYVRKTRMNAVVGGTIATVVGLAALTVLGGSWYTVGEGYRGVQLRNGAVVGTAEPGLGFKMPVIDSVVDISVQSQARTYEGVQTYSKDQQTASLFISVNYRLPADQVEAIYAEYGGAEGVVNRLLDRQVPQAVKNVFGRFNAVTAINERGRLVNEVSTALMESVKGPIIIESVQIENIDFDDGYERAIAARMEAEVEVQKVKQNAEREKITAEITVIQAQAAADSKLAEAKAAAEATRIQGEAEAAAIKAKSEALKDNAGLIALIQAERWNGALPTTMIPDSTVPFMDVVK